METLTNSASVPSGTLPEKVVERWQLHEAVGVLLPRSRAARCGHQAVPGKFPALRVDAQGRGYYANVRACGSVWHCPFCAAKVGRGRVGELRQAVAAAQRLGWTVTLVTWTVGHSSRDRLAKVLEGLTEAMRWWRGGREWREFAESAGYQGSVRNLEVTWGEQSGWHPHAHGLLFTERRLTEEEAQWLGVRWARAVRRKGGYASERVGLKLSDHDGDVAGYLSKVERELAGEELVLATDERRGWGAAEELVWSHVKNGRAGRFTAWQLLRLVVATGWAEAAEKWVEYAEAFHGKRQLVWSRGLREALGLGEAATDEELAAAEGEVELVVAVFTIREWRRMVLEGRRYELLQVLARGGPSAVHGWLLEWRGLGEWSAAFNPEWWGLEAASW